MTRPVGSASGTFVASSGFAGVGETVAAAPAGTIFDLPMVILEGDQQRQANVTFEKLADDDGSYRIQYPTQTGLDEDVTILLNAAGIYVGDSATRINSRGLPVPANLMLVSDPANGAVRLFSLHEGSGIIEKAGLFGLPTDPAEVQGRSASATYTGDVFLAYTGAVNSGVSGTGTGASSVTVDFDALTLIGTASMDSTSASSASGDFLNGATLDITGTVTTGNDFSGTVMLGTPATGSTLTALDGQLDGAFFGQGAAALGGTISGSMTTTDHGTLPVIGGVTAAE